jgi:3'(2'), 5'-bisphosphate nucleotidase
MKNNLSSLVTPLVNIAVEAGKAILQVYETDFDVDFKEDRTPLTEADRRSHEIIARSLSELAVPGGNTIPILSEEGRAVPYEERKRWKTFWLIDPLDGTKEFVHRNGEFTINIALIHGRAPLLGIVYVPVTDVLYFGLAGQKAGGLKAAGLKAAGRKAYRLGNARGKTWTDNLLWRDALELPLPGKAGGAGVKVVGSRSHAGSSMGWYLRFLRWRYGNVSHATAGSSVKFCLVAEGTADRYPRLGPTWEWDIAAGHAVVNGAGGKVIGCGSRREIRYNKRSLLNGWFICRRGPAGAVLKPGV